MREPNITQNSTANFHERSFLLQREHCVLSLPRVLEKRTIKNWSYRKKIGQSSNLVPPRWSLKSRNSQHAEAIFRVIQTAFPYSSVAQPIRVN